MNGTFQNIPIHGVTTPDRIRAADARQVAALSESIGEVGLLNPITVTPESYSYRLVAGLHRLEACRALGMEQIPAFVVDMDDQRRIIAECDENLCAPTLTPAERATFTARRKAAYEALHPETVHGGDRKSSRKVCDLNEPERFTADTASKTGQSERTVQLNAERGEKIAPEAIEAVRGTKLDRGSYLDALKKVPANEQAAKVKADLDAPEKQKATPAVAPSNDPYSEKRKELRGLTREGLEDEVIGLREENAEHRAAIAKLKRENEELKSANRDLSASNQGAVISRLTKQLQGMKWEKQNALEDARKATFQLKKMKKEQAA